MTAVYDRVPNSLFVSPAEAAYPGRLPDIYAWTCSHCIHDDGEAPMQRARRYFAPLSEPTSSPFRNRRSGGYNSCGASNCGLWPMLGMM